MNSNEINVKEKLVKARNAIRRKLNLLKENRIVSEKTFTDTYQPLIQPLTEIVSKIDAKNNDSNLEFLKKEKKEKTKFISSTPYEHSKHKLQKLTFETPKLEETRSRKQYGRSQNISPLFLDTYEVGVIEPETENVNTEDVNIDDRTSMRTILDTPAGTSFLDQYHELPRIYVEKMIHDVEGAIDHTYGIRYNIESDKWMMGNTIVNLHDKDLIIDNVKYEGTPGLYELLVMNNPNYDVITTSDENNYRHILQQTNAARRFNNPNEQLMGTRSKKYKEVIKPFSIQQKKRGGNLFKTVNSKFIEYKYWNDIHELIYKLQILWAEKVAGHTGHDNEIISIIEELLEEGYIEKPSRDILTIKK
ncbi:hypothetical protein RN001_008987 [Aquatica leii]|uniref:DUF8207 domain-containing protein n=1 Tax=Aquatica leii TaxID=1421715 RepID=A0AAN7PE31_9COLE|nr:hypothetical protein RN001_008987 [Aquatica leii]